MDPMLLRLARLARLLRLMRLVRKLKGFDAARKVTDSLCKSPRSTPPGSPSTASKSPLAHSHAVGVPMHTVASYNYNTLCKIAR